MGTHRTKITREEYLQLVGLKTLADNLMRQAEELVAAAVVITGEQDGKNGHTADLMYGGAQRTVGKTLELLGLEAPK